jgi:GAF domain-containing protein
VGSARRQVDDQVAALTDALEGLYAELDTGARTERFLHEVCRAAVAVVPGADMAGITVLNQDGARTRTATDELMVTIDHVQYDMGEGPCLEAARTQTMTCAGADDAPERWPVFTDRAREFGIRSFLSAPILLDGQSLGSLNLYSRDGRGFGSTDQAVLNLLVVAARCALEAGTRLTAARTYGQQLERALASRASIEQAKGVVMAARNVSADQAFELLVAESMRRNVKVRVVAEEMVADLRPR